MPRQESFPSEPEPEKEFDWSRVPGPRKEKKDSKIKSDNSQQPTEPENQIEETPEQENMSDELKKMAKNIEEEGLPNERKTLEQKIKEREKERDKMYEDANRKIRIQAYKNFKKKRERFRNEHGIKMSQEELEKEDADARKRFGIE